VEEIQAIENEKLASFDQSKIDEIIREKDNLLNHAYEKLKVLEILVDD